jgi:hypothetical protein
MSVQKRIDKYKKIIAPFILSNVYFLSVSHHVVQFWEKPGRIMIALWAVCVPLLSWILFIFFKQAQLLLKTISLKHLLPFFFPVLLISAAITWHYYGVPATFHTITITPLVLENQRIELIEIKANGNIIPPNEKAALKYGWQLAGDILTATGISQPLVVSFKSEINAPVTILFFASSQSGNARLLFEHEKIDVDLQSAETRQTTTTFYIQAYRGIPNWFFIPLLAAVDVITLGSFFLAIFFLQQMWQNGLIQMQAGKENPINHRRNITILLILSGILHILNALAVPLILDTDSPSFLDGAVYWLKFGTLDGVSMIRGPGPTLLLAPLLFLFGRNPWGIKAALHLLAIACVPVSYRLGWQLGKNQWTALASGLATVFSPDLFLYSNFLMSDLPNLFFVLVFCTLLISSFEAFDAGWVIATLLMASFATLFRPENITLILISAGALLISYIWRWKKTGVGKPIRDLGMLGLGLILATIPILWWSAHNQRVNGFFGMSNYAGGIIYDGWVYFGDASRLDFSDHESQAVQKLQKIIDQYPIIITDNSGAPTGMEIYPSLIKAGYTPEQGFNLLQQAALDSIRRDWPLTYKLLLLKLKAGLRPETTAMLSLPLPSENYQTPKWGYFDQENLNIPALILAQRKVYEYMQGWYYTFFPWWVYICLYGMFFCLYRCPKPVWLTLILIIGTRIFIPNIMGLSHWRYTLAGWIPLQILGICWIAGLVQGGLSLFRHQNMDDTSAADTLNHAG